MIHHALRFRDNELRCGNCKEQLPGSAAGANITAEYAGPVLMSVTITSSRGAVIHGCGAAEHQAAKPRTHRGAA